jgi:hypothetical protein
MNSKNGWHYAVGFCAIGSSIAEMAMGKSFEAFVMMFLWVIYDEVKGKYNG